MVSPSYFLKIGKNIAGPFSKEKINSLWNDGKLTPLTIVSGDKENWENIQSFLGIYEQEDDLEEADELVEKREVDEERKPKGGPKKKQQSAYPLKIKGAGKSPGAFLVLAGVSWSLLALAMVGGGILLMGAISQKEMTAIQEAAISSFFGTVFIGLYVFVRSIDKILSILDRVNAR